MSEGVPSSKILPSAMNTTRSATSRAKPISWVTTAMVMPSLARSRIRSSTSPTISGSRAEVGSSKSMTSGFMASARTMAIRCFCPPESILGYSPALSARPMRSSSARAWASASAGVFFFSVTGARVMFCRTVLWGNRLKCWNTMPIF